MKRTGFTLIELLAVIVILAIIALIATPIVLDIINDSKESSKKRSQELYLTSLNQALAQKMLNGEVLSDGVYSVKELDVKLKGEMPNDGYVYIKDGNITNYYLSYKEDSISKNLNIVELEKDILNNEDPFSISAVTLSFGNTIELNFYVKKEEMDKYSDVYIIVENDKKFISTLSLKEEIKDYIEKDGYYVFKYTSTNFQEFTNNQTITLVGKNTTGEKKTTISYNVANYIENVTYKENTSEQSKNLLIALANAGGTIQTYFNYNTDKLVTASINESDINTNNILNESAQNLLNINNDYKEIVQSNDNEIFTSGTTGFGVRDTFFLSYKITYKNTPTDEQIKNSGLLLFNKDSFDRMMKNDIDYNLMTADSKYLLKDVNGKTKELKYEATQVKSILQFRVNLDLNDITKQIYYRYYYKDGSSYKYGNIGTITLQHYLKDKIENSTKVTVVKLCTDIANFIALLNEHFN